MEFIEPEGAGSVTAGRAETWRNDYQAIVGRHRAAIRAETDLRGWSFAIHRTDRPASCERCTGSSLINVGSDWYGMDVRLYTICSAMNDAAA